MESGGLCGFVGSAALQLRDVATLHRRVGNDFFFFTAHLALTVPLGARVIDAGYYTTACFLFCSNATPLDYRNAPQVNATLEEILGFRVPISERDGPVALVVGVELAEIQAVLFHVGAGIGSGIEVTF